MPTTNGPPQLAYDYTPSPTKPWRQVARQGAKPGSPPAPYRVESRYCGTEVVPPARSTEHSTHSEVAREAVQVNRRRGRFLGSAGGPLPRHLDMMTGSGPDAASTRVWLVQPTFVHADQTSGGGPGDIQTMTLTSGRSAES
ncbi:hypothetical protein VFPFJ_03941 [Purpureocillium lilacinum]|uniref:Uncharacterized protein n=2 Tax=Purpureocillium lilacinum TaxID=33203 RepID=A0A179HRM4_PURLI|nr:hypothetical protein VFPFJ_03941 [Purpureocillium lilacinum]KAK4089080.1 hypothetical protein Purlil1_6513 [Purpureocillium lilacinum]OAQ92201.1 hypothetical protein VFPFJ_03941 [Purpureocillium lilacinum]PWI69045.1 hypothetical protein PCL_01430 [Purpureocillium lilacinum]